MVCDYNGWNDAPEDEREALDLIEPFLAPRPLVVLPKVQPDTPQARMAEANTHRRAA
jgi:hypothetical protein